MLKTSEWVSLGHPDKMADYISCYLLDRYIERDPNTRYAVEVMVKDNIVTLGGEIASEDDFSDDEITAFVRKAVNEIGYTREYQQKWGRENTICGDEMEVYPILGKQSPDIAMGVNRDAWGDQGIFFGMAVNNKYFDFMSRDYFLARKLGRFLFDYQLGGIDIKTMVSVEEDDFTNAVTVAIPMADGCDNMLAVKDYVVAITRCYNIIVNGTGRYVTHSSIGDCGVTGRKLAADFYGGNCPIGGGSPWTKDPTKADLTLNIHARQLALDFMRDNMLDGCQTALSCTIGHPEVSVSYRDLHGKELHRATMDCPPSALIEKYGLDEPVYAKLCREGLFSVCD